MLVRLSSKGQLVIPKNVRQALDLQPGALFHLRAEADEIVLEPVRSSPLEALYGKYHGIDLIGDLEAEHNLEVEGEAQLCI